MFKVGDKVVLKTPGVGNVSAGTVTSISPKRNSVLVDFGSYKYSFSQSGKIKNSNGCWVDGEIKPISPRIERELLEASTINKCRRLLENKITYDEAVQIINILEDKNVNN